MDVIALAVAGNKLRLHALADMGKMPGKPVERRPVENATPVFGDKHQMHL